MQFKNNKIWITCYGKSDRKNSGEKIQKAHAGIKLNKLQGTSMMQKSNPDMTKSTEHEAEG